MKTLYEMLTVVLWIKVVFGAIMLRRVFSYNSLPGSVQAERYVRGSFTAAALLPALIYLICFFIGKIRDK